ncbi:MAG TPA: glycosyltransferase family 4 protein, partial [Chloroflexota bacterium]|nr:glycosyltransferase family 4 protein [Chloroflexota bacterium]
AGPEEARIRAAIEKTGLSGHVRLLGGVSEDTLWDAYRACDLFVMPNVAVPGDMEGFGLVAIEAGLAARFIVASDLEGIRDAVTPMHNGDLIPAGDSDAFARTIVSRLADRPGLDILGSAAQRFVLENFGWTRTIEEYLRIFDSVREIQAGESTLHD